MGEQDRIPAQSGGFACGRGPLVDAIASFLGYRHASNLSEIRNAVERAIDDAGPGAVEVLSHRLAEAESDWQYYPSDPLARRIHHVLAGPVLQQEPSVSGAEHLETVAGHPLVIFANHLSYADANAIDVLLHGIGRRDICDRLTVIAGPKVYSNLRRRFSSLCFGTIKVPQTSSRASEEATMAVRDVARGARRSIRIAQERLALGEALLVFPEGSRSRSGQMQPLLSGVARYIDMPGLWVLPVGLTGTERLFPIAEDGLSPVPVTLRIGRPAPATVLKTRAHGDRRLIMDCIGFAVAALLPPDYRGVYKDREPATEEASSLATELFS